VVSERHATVANEEKGEKGGYISREKTLCSRAWLGTANKVVPAEKTVSRVVGPENTTTGDGRTVTIAAPFLSRHDPGAQKVAR